MQVDETLKPKAAQRNGGTWDWAGLIADLKPKEPFTNSARLTAYALYDGTQLNDEGAHALMSRPFTCFEGVPRSRTIACELLRRCSIQAEHEHTSPSHFWEPALLPVRVSCQSAGVKTCLEVLHQPWQQQCPAALQHRAAHMHRCEGSASPAAGVLSRRPPLCRQQEAAVQHLRGGLHRSGGQPADGRAARAARGRAARRRRLHLPRGRHGPGAQGCCRAHGMRALRVMTCT